MRGSNDHRLPAVRLVTPRPPKGWDYHYVHGLAKYCGKCGEPKPWTAARIAAADELAKELEELSSEEQSEFVEALRDVEADGPRKEIGAHRIKKLMKRLGSESTQLVRAFAVDVLSDFARKAIFPDSTHK